MDKGTILTGLARAAIASQLEPQATPSPQPDAPFLHDIGACFVTLHEHGELRGCIGSLEAHRQLIDDIRSNALAAAFHDPRFPPLSKEELAEVDIEVSLLTRPEAMSFTREQEVLDKLRPGIDGVILEYGIHRATFLPQVWQQLPFTSIFMAHLKQKAGLPPDFWNDDVQIATYQVEKFAEQTENTS